jgi:hypothetical protein
MKEEEEASEGDEVECPDVGEGELPVRTQERSMQLSIKSEQTSLKEGADVGRQGMDVEQTDTSGKGKGRMRAPTDAASEMTALTGVQLSVQSAGRGRANTPHTQSGPSGVKKRRRKDDGKDD